MQPAAEPIRIQNWEGLVSNRGKTAGKPGQAAVQTNLRVVKRGQLDLRNNAQSVTFASGGTPGQCQALFPFTLDGTDYLILQASDTVSAYEI